MFHAERRALDRRVEDDHVVTSTTQRPWFSAEPDDGSPTCGVLLLSGSSGRTEVDRARLLARHGAAVLAATCFGGPGQPAELDRVPLESFTPALDALAARCERVVVWGSSKGAEAALLVAALDRRVRVVVAVAPSSVVWPAPGRAGGGAEQLSTWTVAGAPLPFVPLLDEWQPSADETADGGVAVRGWYEASLRAAAPAVLDAAALPAERTTAHVVLAAGGDDRVWPAVRSAERLAQRRDARGLLTTTVVEPGAGHRLVLPDEQPVPPGGGLLRGGSPAADAELGRRLWAVLERVLPLRAAVR